MFEIVTHFEIVNFNPLFSDVHCRLEVSLKGMNNDTTLCTEVSANMPSNNNHVRWRVHQEQNCVDYINEDINGPLKPLNEMADSLSTKVQNEVANGDVNEVVNKVSDIFKASAKNVFGAKRVSKVLTNNTNKPWFTNDCHKKRKDFHIAKRKYENSKNATIK